MKFQPESAEGVNAITRHDRHPSGTGIARLWVGNTAFEHSVLVPWRGPVLPWQREGFAALSASDFQQAAGLAPEVVIFGSGARLRFVAPALMRALIERGIGVETMDTAAACRTYNVLVAERRAVVAALLLGAD